MAYGALRVVLALAEIAHRLGKHLAGRHHSGDPKQNRRNLCAFHFVSLTKHWGASRPFSPDRARAFGRRASDAKPHEAETPQRKTLNPIST
jgi:hypothetical protein